MNKPTMWKINAVTAVTAAWPRFMEVRPWLDGSATWDRTHHRAAIPCGDNPGSCRHRVAYRPTAPQAQKSPSGDGPPSRATALSGSLSRYRQSVLTRLDVPPGGLGKLASERSRSPSDRKQ